MSKSPTKQRDEAPAAVLEARQNLLDSLLAEPGSPAEEERAALPSQDAAEQRPLTFEERRQAPIPAHFRRMYFAGGN